ncbi:uncharacterized protein CBL_11171 [Carabus blaptoides fortunei]
MLRCGWGFRCGIVERYYMTDELREAILNTHNDLRNKIAMGQETRGPQPAASNMNILNYNFELEFIAQCHANTCNINHDKCRKGLNLAVGQNLAMESRSKEIQLEDIMDIIVKGIQRWYDEVKDFNTDEVDRFTRSQGVGHYTQIVWADIEYIGCGFIIWHNYKWYTLYLVCNYGGTKTGGNLRNTAIYKKGEVCSKCSTEKSCNDKYKGLCGQVIPISEVYRGIYGRSSTLKFVTIFGANVKQQDLSVCLVITIWCLFTKLLL